MIWKKKKRVVKILNNHFSGYFLQAHFHLYKAFSIAQSKGYVMCDSN